MVAPLLSFSVASGSKRLKTWTIFDRSGEDTTSRVSMVVYCLPKH